MKKITAFCLLLMFILCVVFTGCGNSDNSDDANMDGNPKEQVTTPSEESSDGEKEDYFHVDPCFGGDKAFRKMVNTLHNNDIRVIIDGVFNHCGWNFFAFDDVVRNQEKSGYCDWFYHLEFPVARPEDPQSYPGYACFAYERMMPKLNTANPDVREYFCNVGRYWIEEYGIDGWRLDVASEVDNHFWRAFRDTVKASKPDALLIGEVWESANHWLQGDMFDSAMNYDFRKHCELFFARERIDAAMFSGRVTDMIVRYRVQTVPAQLNLLDSHDVSRFLSLCDGDTDRYCLAVFFMMTFIGMPTVFYGDEQGVQGVTEEEYRRSMPWKDGSRLMYAFFKAAVDMRHDLAALRRGDFRMVCAEKGSRLLAFTRTYLKQSVAVCINAGPVEAALPKLNGSIYWEKRLEDGRLGGYGFGVFVDERS